MQLLCLLTQGNTGQLPTYHQQPTIPPGQPLQVVLLLPCGFLEGPFGMMF